MTGASLQVSFNKMKQMFVSLAALVQSQLFWVYSIIYIAYRKFTPNKEKTRTLRWKPKKDVTRKKKKKNHHHHHHRRRKSLVSSKSKSVIIPPVIPTKGTVAITSLGTTTTKTPSPTHQRAPLLHSYNTFPSPTNKQQSSLTKPSMMIKSQRKKMLRRSCSTGQLNMSSLPALIEVDTRSSEESSICSSMNDADQMRKRDRAIGLLRSTFQRSQSSNNLLVVHKPNSISSAFSSEEEESMVVVVEEKRRKRDAFYDMTRKFSDKITIHNNTVEEIKKQQPKQKLFRSLPSSWKKRR